MRSKKALLNIISSLMLQFVALICGFIIPKLIIANYGSNVNGLLSSITQFLAYITLLEAGIGPVIKAALYKPIANKEKNIIENILKAAEKFFKIIAIIFLVYLAILAFIYPIIVSNQFEIFYTMSLVIIISISIFAEYYFGMTYKLYLQADQKTYITSIIQILGYIFNTLAVVVLIKLKTNIHIVKLVSGLIFVLRPIIQNIYVKKKYKINLKKADENYKLEQKWNGLAQHIASVIHNNTDITILTFFTKITEVSVYSVYYLVIKGVTAIVQAFTGGIDASFGDMIAKGEKEQLNKSFNTYELFYFTVITIVYSCTLLLIVPFVKVYTLGINDVNYIRPLFGFLAVLSEFAWSIRLPYSSITLAAGHFKQTRKGAWVESIVNIIISVALVWRYGIIGVAIGTLIAMLIRTVEFIIHTSKYILGRSILISVKKIFLIIIETIGVIFIMSILPNLAITSYVTWVMKAVITASVASIIVLGINIILFKEETKEIIRILKRLFLKKKV